MTCSARKCQARRQAKSKQQKCRKVHQKGLKVDSVYNVLISSVKIANRICEKYELPYLFSGNIEKRIEVAEFAIEIVTEIFELRRL
jgi:uncharacterized membrane protein